MPTHRCISHMHCFSFANVPIKRSAPAGPGSMHWLPISAGTRGQRGADGSLSTS